MTAHRPLRIFVPHCSDLLTDHRPHGDGLVAQGFIRNLARRGHTLHVMVEQADLCCLLPSNVHLHPFPSAASLPGLNRAAQITSVRRLYRRLQAESPFDIVHQLNPVHTGMSLGVLGCTTPVVLGPYIGSWPGSAPTALGRALGVCVDMVRNLIAGIQQRSADCLLLTTPAAAERLKISSARRCMIQCLPHGIDAEVFIPQTADKRPGSRIDILFMAHVSRRKGIFDLLLAFEALADRFPEATLTIAGDGNVLPVVRQTALTLKCAARVRYLGQQSREGVRSVLQNTDIYCLPSHGEPYGMTAVEAMSCGKPLVVTDAGGLGCLADSGGALKVPVGDPVALSKAIAVLLANPELRKAMGDHNRRRVLNYMAWDRVIDRLEEIYFHMIERWDRDRGTVPRLGVQAQYESSVRDYA